MPDVSVTEWEPGPRKVHTTVAPRAELMFSGTGLEGRTRAGTAEGIARLILFPVTSVNHTFPSGPAAMPSGALPPVGMGYSFTAPEGVILPILLPLNSVNHMFH